MVLRTLSSWFASDAPALSPSHVRPPPEDLATKQEAARSTSAAQGTSDVDSDNNDSNGDESDASSDDDALGDNNRGRHRAESISTAPPASSASAPEVREGGMLSPARGARRRSSPVSEETILAWAKLAWTAMQVTSVAGRRGSGQRGWSGQAEEDADPTLCMTHAGYLKLFQLARPCLSRTYDVIMLDEAQDSNPCIASIVLRETACARILVGDSHQVCELSGYRPMFYFLIRIFSSRSGNFFFWCICTLIVLCCFFSLHVSEMHQLYAIENVPAILLDVCTSSGDVIDTMSP